MSLKNYIPRAGLILPDDRDILDKEWQDKKLFVVLKATVVLDNGTTKALKASRKSVDETLASIFTTALQPHAMSILWAKKDGYTNERLDFLSGIQQLNKFAGALGESTFYHLFGVLVQARLTWEAHRRPPFNIDEHSLTAKEVARFIKEVPSWTNADIELYEWVGGFEEEQPDEVEDEDVAQATSAFEQMEVDDEDDEENKDEYEYKYSDEEELEEEKTEDLGNGIVEGAMRDDDAMDIDE